MVRGSERPLSASESTKDVRPVSAGERHRRLWYSHSGLYIYSDADHPKRGFRYGAHFSLTGRYRDIRHVLWPDGSKGYVREGEYCRIDHWWERQAKARPVDPRRRALWQAARERRAARLRRREAQAWAAVRQRELEQERADGFCLEHC